MVGADALAEVIAKRREFLAALAAEPRAKPGLVEATDTSRSTVDRAIGALEDAGLVDREDGVYRLTATGKHALAEFEGYRERLGALATAHDVVGSLPPTADLHPAALVGATVEESPRYAQDVAFEQTVALVRRASRLRAVGPVVPPRYLGDVHDCVAEGELTVQFVVTPDVAALFERTECDRFVGLADHEGVTLRRLDESVPYALWIAECEERTHSGIVVYADTGVKGVVRNDTDAMTDWATTVFEDYFDRAREFEPGATAPSDRSGSPP